jgi:hypothetical protein
MEHIVQGLFFFEGSLATCITVGCLGEKGPARQFARHHLDRPLKLFMTDSVTSLATTWRISMPVSVKYTGP